MTFSMAIAFWCVLLIGMMPVFCVAFAKVGSPYDNNLPRDYAQKLEGKRKRAYAAHLNCYEAFPFFAVAVIIAYLTQKPERLMILDLLAVLFVMARISYVGFYLTDKPTLRSIMWALGWFVTIAIFTVSVWL
jgi:uncharacterized MAPEG superfamily protein